MFRALYHVVFILIIVCNCTIAQTPTAHCDGSDPRACSTVGELGCITAIKLALPVEDWLKIYSRDPEDLRDYYNDNVELVQSVFMNHLGTQNTIIELINSMTPVEGSLLQQPIAVAVPAENHSDTAVTVNRYMQGEVLLSLHYHNNKSTIEVAGSTGHSIHHLLRAGVEFALQQAPNMFQMSMRRNTLLLITVPRLRMLSRDVYRIITIDVEAYGYTDEYAGNINTQGVLLLLRRDFDLSRPGMLLNSVTGNLFSASFWISRLDLSTSREHQPFMVVESFSYAVNSALSSDMDYSIRRELLPRSCQPGARY